MKTRFNFQINTSRRPWDTVPIRSRFMENRTLAVALARRIVRRYAAEVRLTEGEYPYTTSGSYFNYRDA